MLETFWQHRAACRPRSCMANSCVLLSRDNWLWRHFLGYSLTYCVFISSGQAPMQRPPWINAAFVKCFHSSEQLSTAPQALFCPGKCMSAVRAARNEHSGWETVFHYRGTANFRYHVEKKKNVSEEAPVRDKLKQDTPVNCAYLMCVHNAYLAEIWLGYT